MKKQDAIYDFKISLKNYINNHYYCAEDFCLDKGLSKATVSNLLNSKKDFQISTLEKIAKATGKKLKITLV